VVATPSSHPPGRRLVPLNVFFSVPVPGVDVAVAVVHQPFLNGQGDEPRGQMVQGLSGLLVPDEAGIKGIETEGSGFTRILVIQT
jgi:hypothetical protein